MKHPLLTVRHLTKEYLNLQTQRRSPALRDVSFEVAAGDFVSIVGASGCGKTTLLRMIAGLFPPTSGEIAVEGVPVRGPGADRGMVFQEYAIFPWKTVLENVAFSLLVKRVPKAERLRRAMGYLDLVGLADSADRYPRELSGGMRQRVAVARGLCQQPKILLMDEPFAAVDAVQRQELQEELSRICTRTQTTVLFVTHSVDEAAFLADRVIVLNSSPGEVLTEMAMGFPRPRTWVEMSGFPAFNEMRSALLKALRHGSKKTEEVCNRADENTD